jgi:hypothetical protein
LDYFEGFFNSMKGLLVYMEINEPSIDLEPSLSDGDSQQLKFYHFEADQFMVLDGFVKERNPCCIVLNGPKINHGSFAGIKPYVIGVSELPKGYKEEDILDYSLFDSLATKTMGS